MTTSTRREQLMIYLADVADARVDALYTLLENEMQSNSSYTLSEEQIKIVEERRADYLSGNSIPVPWDEAIERIKKNRKKL